MTESTQTPQTTDEFADLVSASESSTSFWDNPLDEEDWHPMPPTLASDDDDEPTAA